MIYQSFMVKVVFATKIVILRKYWNGDRRTQRKTGVGYVRQTHKREEAERLLMQATA